VQRFSVPVAELLGQPGAYRDLSIRAPLEGVAVDLARLGETPIEAELRAQSVVEGILVTGRVAGASELRCARCLKQFSSSLDLEVCELFAAPGHEGVSEDAYAVAGTEMDLEPMLRDVIALALPLHPVCTEECKGMCAQCGTDLNTGTCECTEDDTDPRWAPLDALRAKLEEHSSA
jgi:DUF177 domain-containing protein